MSNIFESGPESAFPSTFKSLDPEAHQVHRWGMTLRDYFAAKAMQAMACAPMGKFQHASGTELCRDAYAMADAMLRAREEA